MLGRPEFKWNDQTVKMLHEAIAGGYSAAETASIFAQHYFNAPSRSAVLGKAFRLGTGFGGDAPAKPRVVERTKPGRYGFPWRQAECEAKFRELIAAGSSTREIMAEMAKEFPQAPLLTTGAVQMQASKLGLSIGGGRKRRAGSSPISSAPRSIRPAPAQGSGREFPHVLPPVSPSRNPPTDAPPAIVSAPESERGDVVPGVAPFSPAHILPTPSTHVTIFELEYGMCKWPLGNPADLETFRYCGAEAKSGASYCASHHALAYIPAKDRKRTKAQEDADDKRRAAMLKKWAMNPSASRAYSQFDRF